MSAGSLYTWRDVERALASEIAPPWTRLSADGAGLYIAHPIGAEQPVHQALARVFGNRFSPGTLILESAAERPRQLPVVLETMTNGAPSRVIRPLWPDSRQPVNRGAPPPAPRLLAFYSYKGGVGRTTTLLAVLAELLGRSQEPRVLVVDADLEAPGVTWILPRPPSGLSLLDALGLVHDEEDWETNALPLIESRVRQNVQSIETAHGRRDFFLLPAFREEQQIFEPGVTLEQMVRARGRRFIVGDFLAALGCRLGVDVVLIDLRAGVTELASPLLLDPWVQTILVTSVADQSIAGTSQVLLRMRSRTEPDTRPEVVLTMVPANGPPGFIEGVEERLFAALPGPPDDALNASAGATVHRVELSQELLHYDGLEDLFVRRLPGTDLGKRVAPGLAALLVPIPRVLDALERGAQNHQVGLAAVAEFAKRLEYAESNAEVGLLPIPALEALVNLFASSVPAAVVVGSKGSGKTFAWAQLVISGTWDGFAGVVGVSARATPFDRLVFPLLAPQNLAPDLALRVKRAEGQVHAALGGRRSPLPMMDLRDRLERIARVPNDLAFWVEQIAHRLGLPATAGRSVETLAAALERADTAVVLVIDGLEDAFQFKLELSPEQGPILRALLQRFTNEVRDLGSPRLGVVSFVRRDIAADAIQQNFGQFEALHDRFALTWSPTDALRLPAWILARAGRPVIEEGRIPRASYDDLRLGLQRFWGVRVGSERSREAYTDRWVIAALSDLQGRLQPRDLVRLIRHAAELTGEGDQLAPVALRTALRYCSEQKITELETEVRTLKGLFDRLRRAPPEKKAIPFSPSDFGLKTAEVEFLRRQGIVTSLEDVSELYMPEIVRQGLGFALKEGRRAKVLALYRAIQART